MTYLKPSNRIRLNLFLLYTLIFLIGIILACDTENLLNTDFEMLEIEVKSDSQELIIGDTTTLKATVDYSGDPSALIYKWSANDGRILGNGSSIVYVAPQSAGRYTITLEVTDGNTKKTSSIHIDVEVGNAIILLSNRYWNGNAFTQELTFRLRVDEIHRENITLRYEILQDSAEIGAFLSIAINDTNILQDHLIGTVQPDEPLIVIDDIDISHLITDTGIYEVKLTLDVVDVMENAWLLKKLVLIGLDGTLTEIQ
ncbi:hypothetical protein C6497_13545 [Candidatus Poribacteria bacterium]|nr:MAG: hypothetical protein C6497_13545 [Candidatus Poribacteria bacterium]